MFGAEVWKRVAIAFVYVCTMALVWSAISVPAFAQQGWDRRTRVTFSAPVEVPGQNALILPAGSYIFRLLNSQVNRHIVQIFNADETELYTTILAIPNYRRVATDQTVITFEERPAGQPPAIQAWFYPGDNWGHEFAYPRERALQLAAAAEEPVLFIPEAVATAAAEVEPTPEPTAPEVVALAAAPVRAVDPAGEVVPVTEVVQEPPTQVAGLPRTSSSLPALALVGLVLIGASLSLRRVLCLR